MRTIQNKNTFRFFNYKWKKVPHWGNATSKLYIKWYLRRYKYNNLNNLKKFLKDKKNILEAGCGLARDTILFAKLNKKSNLHACDQSPIAVKFSKKYTRKYNNVSIFRQDITKKFKNNIKHDFISCDQVLHHTPNPKKTLNNLFSILNKDGYLNFFVCKKKNSYRDLLDDHIMNNFRNKSPRKLWDFAVEVTKFAKTLHNLKIKNVKFNKKKYSNLQLFFHFNSFRAWYNPEINFDLSVSSNYDWFSNNPRYSMDDVKKILKSINGYKIISIFEDDASISVSIKKTRNI